MNDLDTLRPEVREAIRDLAIAARLRPEYQQPVGIIRAELLRLTDDCARLVDCINAQPPTRRSLIDRAERAEAELAALRKRIEDAPVALVSHSYRWSLSHTDNDGRDADLPREWRDGQRVRLVRVE